MDNDSTIMMLLMVIILITMINMSIMMIMIVILLIIMVMNAQHVNFNVLSPSEGKPKSRFSSHQGFKDILRAQSSFTLYLNNLDTPLLLISISNKNHIYNI